MAKSFAEYAKEKKGSSKFISELPIGEYTVKFLGATLIPNKFDDGNEIPEYHFELDGTERTLNSHSKSLLTLAGKEGQTVTLIKTLGNGGKTSYKIR